jgi:dinuclear metal center YbgI/SA1388 family protein
LHLVNGFAPLGEVGSARHYSSDVSTPTVRDVVEQLDAWYPPSLAEEWDSVGLVAGDLAAPVRRVLFAVDPLPAVVDEAVEWGADLLITHHPLLLRPVHSIATDTWKGAALHRLVRAGCALFTAHTNADSAADGVNDALAAALGLDAVSPLRALPSEASDKLVTFVPPEYVDVVVDALRAMGAGQIGDYSGCAWWVDGTGAFTPEPGADPHIGVVGRREVTAEARLEMLVPRRNRRAALEAIRTAHPYEEVAIDVHEVAATPSGTGLGRVGALSRPCTLAELAQQVAGALPGTPQGVRFFGEPERLVERVAVCSGSGDSLLPDASASGADVYVTADLRHHPASEHLAGGGPALIDPGHWASEWPWLPRVAARLQEVWGDSSTGGTTVETRVSTLVTDPVSGHVHSRPEEER